MGQPGKLRVRENVSGAPDAPAFDVPVDGHIPVGAVRGEPVAQESRGGRRRAIMPRVIAVVHVEEDSALWRRQPRELAERFQALSARMKDA